ncbi:MAG: hypothetical protein MJ010_01690 [Paludibacteraceae bacterium]|nr:hypothetical protein [Paludibacteraceae bacterium]
MEQKNQQNEQKEEMDLIDIIKCIWGWFVSFIWNPIIFIIRYCLKKWWQCGLFILVGIMASICYWLILPKYSVLVNYTNCIGVSMDYINDIKLVAKGSDKSVARDMRLPIETVKNIKMIKPHAIYFADSTHTYCFTDYKDTVKVGHYDLNMSSFCVEFVVKDLQTIHELETSIVNLFSDHKQLLRANEQRFEQYKTIIEFATEEINALDSLRYLEYNYKNNKGIKKSFEINKEGSLIATTTTNPIEYTQQIINLKRMVQQSEEGWKYNSEIVKTAGPARFIDKPINHFVKTIIPFSICFLCLGVIVMLCVDYRKKIIDFINK